MLDTPNIVYVVGCNLTTIYSGVMLPLFNRWVVDIFHSLNYISIHGNAKCIAKFRCRILS